MGLNKRGLINALRKTDNDNDDVEGIGENVMQSGRDGEELEDDGEVQFWVPTQQARNGDVIATSGGNSEMNAGGGDDSSRFGCLQEAFPRGSKRA